jgi:NADPH-dependent glutamate synthase beta subunit-like oxidoreductase
MNGSGAPAPEIIKKRLNKMSLYDITRVAPCSAPPEFDDNVGEVDFVPAPCQVACPIGTDAPSYIAYIWENKIEEAFEAITATNPFSSICGRVCDAPCEPACRRVDSDGAIAIRNLKRYVMDKLGRDHRLAPIEVSRTESIGIVGSGPAGMTAAHALAADGFEVHVYEMSDRLGGMMVWGIPAFRLPPGIIDEDMKRILDRCPGIKPHLNCALGRDVTLEELKGRHDAVLLTIGAWWGKSMDIPGADDPHVIDGVEFLRRVNGGDRTALPETVLVIGGGDVAMDACRVAKRFPGCKDVKVLYRRGPDEIPARRDELEGAIKEGIEFVYHTQPVAVVTDGGKFALRCVETRLGEPGEDGRRRPENISGSERDIPCDMVILSVGQQAVCGELDGLGLMAGDRVRTDWETMRTGDAKVFAAGDGAFGGSTIVMAMQHGQRSAYYIKAFLDGRDDPLPYRTPFRTRRVPVAQDPDWEIIPRQEQPFHGLGAKPEDFPEIETTYDDEAARAEAARCYRCDAETGSADYSVHNREDIFVMARTAPEDAVTHKAILQKRLRKVATFPAGDLSPTLEDLVFLPANLSRLVIDPYRDACKVGTRIGDGLEIISPFIVTGFDDAPSQVREDLARGLSGKHATLGRRALADDIPWLQLIFDGETEGDPTAAAQIHGFRDGFRPPEARRRYEGQLLGLALRLSDLDQALPFALEAGYDLLVLDGTSGLSEPWVELEGEPDLSIVRDTIRALRRMNREEDIELVYFGGVRSGTDTAKLIGLGCRAVVVGAAMGFALGGRIEGDTLAFHADYGDEDRERGAADFLAALTGEVSIMARCTGKTDIHNLEPEDMRSITIATARATGIPLAGTDWIPEEESV